MSADLNARYDDYRAILGEIIDRQSLPFSVEVLRKLTPHWTEESRQEVINGLWRGTIREAIPSILVPGCYGIAISKATICIGKFEVTTRESELYMVQAEAFSHFTWGDKLLAEEPRGFLYCTIIPPGRRHEQNRESLDMLVVLSLPFEVIVNTAWSDRENLRTCLAQHISCATTSEVEIHELRAAFPKKPTTDLEICWGCGRHCDHCNCFSGSWVEANSLIALPPKVMWSIAPIAHARFAAAVKPAGSSS